jgi:hypothetical protein
MPEERRHFSRVNFSAKVSVRYEGQYLETELIDISLKGALIRFSGEASIDKGARCFFEFRLDQSEIVLNIDARVVYTQDGQYGLRFENLDLESMIHLRRLIELNIGDPDQIQQELFFLVNPK